MTGEGELVSAVRSSDAALYLENSDFAKVILEFLGKKEQLSYASKHGFVATHNDIENFYFLLRDKIGKEQPFSISHFQVDINYNDNTTRSLSGIEGLSGFAETRDVSPESVVLSWNIIVKYPDAATVENQKISILLTRDSEDEDASDIFILIDHTNQVWAAEVLNLLKQQVKIISHRNSKKYDLARSARAFMKGRLGLMLIMLLVTYISVFSMLANHSSHKIADDAEGREVILEVVKSGIEASDSQIALISVAFLGYGGMKEAASQIKNTELAGMVINAAESRKDGLIRTLSFIACVILLPAIIYMLLCEYVHRYQKTSHILLTRRSEKELAANRESQSRGRFISMSAILLSIGCGVIGNFVFQYVG